MTDKQSPELTEGEQDILKRLVKHPIPLYYGRAGWTPGVRLPGVAKRADFDRLCKRNPALVKIECGDLKLIEGEQHV